MKLVKWSNQSRKTESWTFAVTYDLFMTFISLCLKVHPTEIQKVFECVLASLQNLNPTAAFGNENKFCNFLLLSLITENTKGIYFFDYLVP